MSHWITVGVVLSVALPAAMAVASDDRPVQAQLRYESGMAHFNLQEWDAAIADWQEGYRIKPVPEFLFNIAQAYRKSDRPDKALFFYERYLSLAPNGPDRADVERQAAAMRTRIAERREAPHSPAPAPTEAQKPPAVAPPLNAAPTVDASPSRTTLTAAPSVRKKPVYKKAWFWGTLGTVAVVAAGGVVLGVMLGGTHRQTLDAVVY
jgi:tetratricopeptide (TPR) repeat protein